MRSMAGAAQESPAADLTARAGRLAPASGTVDARHHRRSSLPHIRTIDSAEATGELAEAYRAMAERPMPSVYRPPHGGAPGIILAHSLDPVLLRTTFAVSASLATDATLAWPARELINTVTSRVNQCLY